MNWDGLLGERRRRTALFNLGAAALASTLWCPGLAAQQTRAERSNYTETSTHADVMAFLDSLERAAPGQIVRGEIGRSADALVLPYVLVSRPLARTPAGARASGKPIVYIQGNIHGGEVEGKESLQAILRDLVLSPTPNVLDSLVLIIVPLYNADGNEAMQPQQRMRGSQNGPELVGRRTNGQDFDLNRDYIKAESPEAVASLMMFAQWNPDVFVDLHATNGSYHGYALTYSPSLHPAAMDGALAPAGPWTRDTLLPEVRRRVRERRNVETFDYGNFVGAFSGRDDVTSLQKGGWETYEHKPRFGTNYSGLRNRVSVLAEAYSHDPFQRRVEATTAYVMELFSYIAEQGATVLARTRMAPVPAIGTPVPIRAEMTRTPFTASVLVEALEATGDSIRYEAGLRPGFRRTNRIVPVEMPVWDRFDVALTRALPSAWVIKAPDLALLSRLAFHGIPLRQLSANAPPLPGEQFIVDSIIRAPRPFQGHNEMRIEGRWEPTQIEMGPDIYLVMATDHTALLAAILLEPQSDDGFTTWNFFDGALRVGEPHPVRRVTGALLRSTSR